mgnify:CR=1 FL=1|tara:strand:- start:3787 stop:4239 length:453 start_codon:yes stop_codon:yes gene_type:complete
MDSQNKNLDALIDERVARLPESVIDAIESIGIEERLQRISKNHNLHLDKWAILEGEIMLTLLGITDPDDLTEQIAKKVGVEMTQAQLLVNDIADAVFTPIREKMQSNTASEKSTQPASKSAPSDTTAYRAGENSMHRKDVGEDPYRESIE